MMNTWKDGGDAPTGRTTPLVRTGLVRNIDRPPIPVWAVSPMGVIKPLYVTVGVTPPMLDIVWMRKGTRIIGIETVAMKHAYRSKGWRILQELYMAEDRQTDWETFLEHRKQIIERGVRTEIGDEYLPQALLDFRERIASRKGKAELPLPQAAKPATPGPRALAKAKKAKAEAEAAKAKAEAEAGKAEAEAEKAKAEAETAKAEAKAAKAAAAKAQAGPS